MLESEKRDATVRIGGAAGNESETGLRTGRTEESDRYRWQLRSSKEEFAYQFPNP